MPLDGHLLQEYYVNRPGDPVGKLAQVLDLSETPQHILLVGQRGVGKTTELRRLADSLGPGNFGVVHNLDHESISNPSRAIGQLAGDLERRAINLHLPWIESEDAQSRSKTEWASLNREIARYGGWGRRLVLLVDGLEKRQGRKLESVARLAAELRRIECSIVLVVPLSMVLLPEASAEVGEWDRVVVLPAISLRHRDGSVDGIGRQLLRTVIDRRDPSGVFDRDAKESLVNLSAGIHRTLLTLAQDACLNAMSAGTPRIDRNAVEEAGAERGLEMNGFLTPRFLNELASVRDTKLIRNFNEALPLLERNSIVAYQNSSPWYDVNPLVSSSLAAFVGRAEGSSRAGV